MELSFCVVNTNGGPLLARCLDAIERTAPPGVDYEVIVLDNASDDGSAESARRPGVRLIELGWGGDEPSFRQHGALVQELVPPTGSDLRLVVAGGKVVGGVSRAAAEGEWRTNVALGATRLPIDLPAVAVELALAAARSVGAALVGVDLLPTPDGGLTILEVNGSVEFTHDYRVGRDVFRAVVLELARVALEAAPRDRPTGADPVLA